MPVFNRFLLWPLLLTGHFLCMCLLSWHLLAQLNFGYPLGYQLLSIDKHIQHYGPENRYKNDFAQTTPEEHAQLFQQIVAAIQDGGKGLAEISYRLPDGSFTPLMRTPEVIHLQDVANLVEVFYRAGIIGGLLWLALTTYAYCQRQTFPSLKKILIGFASALAAISAVVFIIGPKNVFYWLHVKIFPDEHEWFFFYEDSLMTTLMKAPDLFGFISVLLIALIIVCWAITVWAMARAFRG